MIGNGPCLPKFVIRSTREFYKMVGLLSFSCAEGEL